MINPIVQQITQLSERIGLDVASLSMAICLFGSFPLNAILKRLPDNNILLKNVYIISISAFYLFGILGLLDGFRTLFVSSMFTYFVTKYVRGKKMPIINFAFVMGHLAMNHIYYQFFNDYDASKVDITGAQMVLVMKLTSFAWCVYDGSVDPKELSSYQKLKAIRQHPPLLNFISYTFFYPSLLTGPSFDYIDYENWLNCKLFSDLPESKKPGKRRKRNIPKSGRVAFYRVLQSVGWLLLWQKMSDFITMDTLFSEEYKQYSFIVKMIVLYILGFSYRLKYYSAWTLSEASCILAGLGYNGYDKENKVILWNRVQNIDIFALETSENLHGVFEAWNQNTNKWLKNYVYLRVVKPGKKPGFKSTVLTFSVSAFWHGTRPGYYLSFVTGALLQTCGKIYRRNLRPIFLEADGTTGKESKLFYDIVCYIVTQLTLGYLVQPFMILDLHKSLYVWGSVGYVIHVGILVTFVLFETPLKGLLVSPVLRKFKPTARAQADAKKHKPAGEDISTVPDFSNTELKDIQEGIEEIQQDLKELNQTIQELNSTHQHSKD